MVCPKCKGTNVIVQREQTGSIGGSHTTVKKRRHGLLYYLLVAWWIWIFKLLFLPFTILFGRRKKIASANTISAQKTFNKTVAVCQDCGHSWKV